MNNWVRILLILSLLWSSLPVFAQPPFAFSHEEQKEYLEQLLEEFVEDEARVSHFVELFLNGPGRRSMILLSREYFGERLKDSVNESLSLLMARELELELDEDYTRIVFDDVYVKGPIVLGGLMGAAGGAVITKLVGVTLLSISGAVIPMIGALAVGAIGRMAFFEGVNLDASFNNINEMVPNFYRTDEEYRVMIDYRSNSRWNRAGGFCRLSFGHTLIESALWKVDYQIRNCSLGDGGVIDAGSFTIDERDMLAMFAQRLVDENEY